MPEMVIDEKPAMYVKFERNALLLESNLHSLAVGTLAKAKEAIRREYEKSVGKHGKEPDLLSLQETLDGLEVLAADSRYQKHQLNLLAKSSIYSLQSSTRQIRQLVLRLDRPEYDILKSTIEHLYLAVYFLSQYKYPNEFKFQQEVHEASHQAQVTAKREELLKKQVR